MINDQIFTTMPTAAPGIGGFVEWCEQELQKLRAQTGMRTVLPPHEAARAEQKISGLQALIAKYSKQAAA